MMWRSIQICIIFAHGKLITSESLISLWSQTYKVHVDSNHTEIRKVLEEVQHQHEQFERLGYGCSISTNRIIRYRWMYSLLVSPETDPKNSYFNEKGTTAHLQSSQEQYAPYIAQFPSNQQEQIRESIYSCMKALSKRCFIHVYKNSSRYLSLSLLSYQSMHYFFFFLSSLLFISTFYYC